MIKILYEILYNNLERIILELFCIVLYGYIEV